MLDYKYLIKKAGLTQPLVAAEIGISSRKLSDILNNKKQFKDYEEEKFLQVVKGNSANVAEPRTNYNKTGSKDDTIRNLSKVALIALQNGEMPNSMIKATMEEWVKLQDEVEVIGERVKLFEEVLSKQEMLSKTRKDIISFSFST